MWAIDYVCDPARRSPSTAARAVILVAKDPQNETRRFFVPTKLNIGPKLRPLAFRIDQKGIHWESEPVSADAQDLLDGEPVRRRGPSKVEQAETLLLDLL